MALGISSWSVPWAVGVPAYPAPASALDAVGLVDCAGDLDVPIVQIADNLPLAELDSHALSELCDASDQRGVALQVGTRGFATEHLARYAEIASAVGASMLRTVFAGSHCTRAQLREVQDNLVKLQPALEKNGVVLAVENNEAFSAREFAELVRTLASPWVGICLDTANSLGRPETVEAVVDALAEHTVMLHAKDYDIERIDTRMGFRVIGRAAGDGRVDFAAVFAALDRRPDVIIEHWPPFLGEIEATVTAEREWLERSIAFFRSGS